MSSCLKWANGKEHVEKMARLGAQPLPRCPAEVPRAQAHHGELSPGTVFVIPGHPFPARLPKHPTAPRTPHSRSPGWNPVVNDTSLGFCVCNPTPTIPGQAELPEPQQRIHDLSAWSQYLDMPETCSRGPNTSQPLRGCKHWGDIRFPGMDLSLTNPHRRMPVVTKHGL